MDDFDTIDHFGTGTMDDFDNMYDNDVPMHGYKREDPYE